MPDFDYTVRCSAVLDRSSAVKSLTDWISLATAAKKKVDEILGAPVKVAGGKSPAKAEADARITEAQRAAKELERIRERENNQILRDVEKQTRAEERAHERAQRYVAGVKDRYFAQQQKEEEKADNKRQARAKQIASDSLSNMRAVAGAAARIGGEVVGGLGVDFSLSRGVAKARELESAAVAISNKGNRGGRVQSPEELQKMARDIGEEFRVDPTKVLAGLDKFQSLTGDLDLGKLALKDLTGLSRAFKVDLDQLVGSAGNVASKIGDVGKEFKTPQEKAAAMLDVMKALVAQGQEGAIEMPDLVTQLSALGAAAPRFQGSRAENIAKMGALAQLALQTGGAKSASQAATAVMGFANTLSTPKRRDEFKRLGIEIDSPTEKGKFVDPYEIIRQSLLKTGGDVDKMKKLFSNVVGERAVASLTQSFLGAGGGQAGVEAVNKQLGRFGGTVSNQTIKENLARELATKESKAIDFQNRLDKITASLADRILPALEQLADPAAKAASALASIVEWAASHPFAAIGVAVAGSIAASIAKATIGEVAGNALAKAVSSMGGKGLAIASIVATAATAYLYLQKTFDEGAKGQNKLADVEASAGSSRQILREVAAGRITREEALKQLEETYSTGSKAVDLAKKGVGYADALNPFSRVTAEEAGMAQQLREGENGPKVGGKTESEALQANLVSVKEAIESLKTQMSNDAKTVKKVEVVNQPSGPAADQGGRAAQ